MCLGLGTLTGGDTDSSFVLTLYVMAFETEGLKPVQLYKATLDPFVIAIPTKLWVNYWGYVICKDVLTPSFSAR